MAIPAYLAAAGIKAGSSLINYLTRPKRRKFDETPYAQRLKQLMEKGIYSPGMRSEMIGDVARSAGNITQMTKTGYRGRLASMGMGRSIAGASKEADIGTQHAEQLAETSRRIGRENVLAKSGAADEYARAKTGYQERVQEMQDKQRQGLVSGLTGAAGGALTQYAQTASLKDVDWSDPQSAMGWVMSQPDPKSAINMMQSLGYAQRYMGGGGFDEGMIMEMLSKRPDQAEEILNQLFQLGLLPKSLVSKLQ